MKTINFTYNWNNKLDCKAFTTFRLRNPAKYKIGESYQILLKGKVVGTATIVQILPLTLDKVNEWIARLDTGYSLPEFKKLVETMYKNKVNVRMADFSLLLLHKEKEETHG